MRKSAISTILALQIASIGCGGNGDSPANGATPTSAPIATPTPSPSTGPELAISVETIAAHQNVHIVARVQHVRGAPVSVWADGCTGSGMIDASGIDFALADSEGRLLSLAEEYPCGPAQLCPIGLLELSEGQSITREFDFDGTAWLLEQPEPQRRGCDDLVPSQSPYPRCVQTVLPAGGYTVVATLPYCIDRGRGVDGSVEGAATFQWP